MKKPDLVLVHSFPANSIIFEGFTSFMKDYFKVHFIDLPGFIPDVPPLKKISLKNYAKHVQDEIKKLKLKDYWLAGVSFGFLIADKVKTGKNCKGLIAIEPYLNALEIKMPWFQKYFLLLQINIVHLLGLYEKAWRSEYFKGLLAKDRWSHYTQDILDYIDARTFFETAKILLIDKKKIRFQGKPHILVINKNDDVICADYVEEDFKKHVKQLLIVYTDLKHHPGKMTKSYFSKHIKKENMKEILKFIRS